MTWKVQHIQFVLFGSPSPESPDAHKVWTSLFDLPPETFQRPRGPVPVSQAAGVVDTYQFTLVSQPGRIELFIARNPEQGDDNDGLLTELEPALAELHRLARKAVFAFPTTRVAYVTPLIMIVESYQAASTYLHNLLPFLPLTEDSRDVVFQSNVRKKLNLNPDIEINRICTWMSSVQQTFSIGFGPVGSAFTPGIVEKYAVTFQIDVNSATTHLLPPEQAERILEELVVETKNLKLEGYQRLTSND